MGKFCILCETQIEEGAEICDNCGEPQIVEKSIQNQSIPDIKIKNQVEGKEVIICKGIANWCESTLIIHKGQGVLTSKRFIYFNHNFLKTFALGALVYLTDGEYEFDIPLKNIVSVSEGKHNLGKVLMIETRDGLAYKFGGVRNRKQWIDNISKHIR